MSEALSKIVRIQIEMENKYPDIYFEFLVDPLKNKDDLDTSEWSPLYKRE